MSVFENKNYNKIEGAIWNAASDNFPRKFLTKQRCKIPTGTEQNAFAYF